MLFLIHCCQLKMQFDSPEIISFIWLCINAILPITTPFYAILYNTKYLNRLMLPNATVDWGRKSKWFQYFLTYFPYYNFIEFSHFYSIYVYVWVLAYMYNCVQCADWYLHRWKEGFNFPKTGARDDC